MSLRMLHLATAQPDGLIDIGGGSTPLAGVLLEQGVTDVTVLDISATALGHAQQRLGPAAQRVRWLHADVLTWRPERRYRIWHDRALFHFLTDPTDQQRSSVRTRARSTNSGPPGWNRSPGDWPPTGCPADRRHC